jgi:cation diffusion facilitator CzcD-associated flavoprotein CzcO
MVVGEIATGTDVLVVGAGPGGTSLLSGLRSWART